MLGFRKHTNQPEENVRTKTDLKTSVQTDLDVPDISEEDKAILEKGINEFVKKVNPALKHPVKEEKPKPVILKEVVPEEIKPSTKKKVYDDVALIGNTIECREFRAIIKKKGLTIKETLTKIVNEWNTANYNL